MDHDAFAPRDGVTVMDALGHEYRRQTLSELEESTDNTCTIDDVTDAILASENTRIRSETHEDVRARLYHTHLPKLADAGLLDYHWATGDVTYIGDEPTDTLLETVTDPLQSQETASGTRL